MDTARWRRSDGAASQVPLGLGGRRERLDRNSLLGFLEIERAIDEPDVAERLREVPEQAFAVGIEFFGEQSERGGVLLGILEDLADSLDAAGAGKAPDQPERTRYEGLFLTGEAIVFVPMDETSVGQQALLDGVDGPLDAFVREGKESQ